MGPRSGFGALKLVRADRSVRVHHPGKLPSPGEIYGHLGSVSATPQSLRSHAQEVSVDYQAVILTLVQRLERWIAALDTWPDLAPPSPSGFRRSTCRKSKRRPPHPSGQAGSNKTGHGRHHCAQASAERLSAVIDRTPATYLEVASHGADALALLGRPRGRTDELRRSLPRPGPHLATPAPHGPPPTRPSIHEGPGDGWVVQRVDRRLLRYPERIIMRRREAVSVHLQTSRSYVGVNRPGPLAAVRGVTCPCA